MATQARPRTVQPRTAPLPLSAPGASGMRRLWGTLQALDHRRHVELVRCAAGDTPESGGSVGAATQPCFTQGGRPVRIPDPPPLHAPPPPKFSNPSFNARTTSWSASHKHSCSVPVGHGDASVLTMTRSALGGPMWSRHPQSPNKWRVPWSSRGGYSFWVFCGVSGVQRWAYNDMVG